MTKRYSPTWWAPVVLLACAALTLVSAGEPTPGQPQPGCNVRFRENLTNSRVQFEIGKTGHVAFMGGSITEMNGYRPMVCEILQHRFPDTQFTFTDAGISSTCSTSGAFRLERDVLNQGPVDLFFVEFAVNDDQDAGHSRRECIRGMEGIVRHVRDHNPHADIIITYFTNPGMVATIQGGGTPVSSGAHEEVAKYYGVSTIDLAREVAQRIADGTLTWKQFGGTHPAPHGNAICAKMIDQLMTLAWKEPLPKEAKKSAHPMPPKPLDANHYGNGHFVDPSEAQAIAGWRLHTPDWESLPGRCRSRFAEERMLCTTEPGSELTFTFVGKAIGAYILAGPDAGVVEASVDGGAAKRLDLFHRFSKGLHYPRTVMFETELQAGRHVLKLKMTDDKNVDSSGHAMRILQFAVN
jgi:lysophospholipase L1-like esterase